MENLKKIKAINKATQDIRDAISKYKTYCRDKDTYDKLGFGFNLDIRFFACDPLNLRVDSWMGMYGNSGCSRILSINPEIFNAHLLNVLNKNFIAIMNQVAESIEGEANEYKDKAVKELNEALEMVNSLDNKEVSTNV